MKRTFLLTFILALAFSINAQQRVVLESNGTSTIYGGDQPFVDAYEAAVDGDVIYLPGTALAVPSDINKSLTIYGAGHYPDGTTATNKTEFIGSITVSENADGLHLEGVDLRSNNISFTTDHKVDNVVIARCKFYQLHYLGTATTPCLNNTVRECVITSAVYLTNANTITLTNNIIGGRIYNGTNNTIQNNILLYNYANSNPSYSPLRNVDNSFITSNVFLKNYNGYVQNECESSTFSNNIFVTNPVVGSNTFEANYTNVALTGLFVNQSGNAFDYTHDYHLSSPETYTNGEGAEAGIYGGLYPYKANAVPSTPHISAKSVAASTDENGLLNISITVSAQED